MKSYIILTVLVCVLLFSPSCGDMDKIKIDPKTRLYVSREDGRVHVLHGLDTTKQYPPYPLVTYTDEQIQLFKTVSGTYSV